MTFSLPTEYWLVRWTDKLGNDRYLSAIGTWEGRIRANRFFSPKEARGKIKIARKLGRKNTKIIHVTVHPVGQCAKELKLLKAALTPSDSAPVSFVTDKRLVRLPEFVTTALGIPKGGGVVFHVDRDGRVRIMSNDDVGFAPEE